VKDMIKRKMKYAEHVLRDWCGVSHLQILEGYVELKKVGAPRRVWMKDIIEWTCLENMKW